MKVEMSSLFEISKEKSANLVFEKPKNKEEEEAVN